MLKFNKFPLCVTLINFTNIVLKTLRQGKLNQYFKLFSNVITTINNLYSNLISNFFQEFQSKNLGIREFGVLIKKISDKLL